MKIIPDQLYLSTLYEGSGESVGRPSGMSTSHEQRSCADLYRMIENEQLILNPPWQRDTVWTNENKTRFLDSLLKGMPIPSVLIAQDVDSGIRYVIDGLQRLSCIKQYFSDVDWSLADISDIDSRIKGKIVRGIRSSLNIHSEIINQTIPVTLIKYRNSDNAHCEHLFLIFYRVNSGSVRLNNQEIRNAIYQGEFNEAIKRCDEDLGWRIMTKRPETVNDRFEFREIILRAFALVDRGHTFSGNLVTFLNRYMASMRKIPVEECLMRQRSFEEVTSLLIRHGIVDAAFHESVGSAKAKIEMLLYGMLKHFDRVASLEPEKLAMLITDWAKGDCLQASALSSKLYGVKQVKQRIQWTDSIFGCVEIAAPALQPVFEFV